MTWGAEIIWRSCDGSISSASTRGCATREDAWRETLALARGTGWTPPRWWQFWRWHDTRIPADMEGSQA